jgi:hypothetical protein
MMSVSDDLNAHDVCNVCHDLIKSFSKDSWLCLVDGYPQAIKIIYCFLIFSDTRSHKYL